MVPFEVTFLGNYLLIFLRTIRLKLRIHLSYTIHPQYINCVFHQECSSCISSYIIYHVMYVTIPNSKVRRIIDQSVLPLAIEFYRNTDQL